MPDVLGKRPLELRPRESVRSDRLKSKIIQFTLPSDHSLPELKVSSASLDPEREVMGFQARIFERRGSVSKVVLQRLSGCRPQRASIIHPSVEFFDGQQYTLSGCAASEGASGAPLFQGSGEVLMILEARIDGDRLHDELARKFQTFLPWSTNYQRSFLQASRLQCEVDPSTGADCTQKGVEDAHLTAFPDMGAYFSQNDQQRIISIFEERARATGLGRDFAWGFQVLPVDSKPAHRLLVAKPVCSNIPLPEQSWHRVHDLPYFEVQFALGSNFEPQLMETREYIGRYGFGAPGSKSGAPIAVSSSIVFQDLTVMSRDEVVGRCGASWSPVFVEDFSKDSQRVNLVQSARQRLFRSRQNLLKVIHH